MDTRALPLLVPKDFPSAELALVAVEGEVVLHLRDQTGVP
jgi:hypothetical protein